MITGLALSNFKSIGKTLIVNDEDITEGKLEFAPLTIFCGKNSSGKSTVLQSILLLAQTLKNNVPSQTLVLNGPMVKLGSVDDIKSNFSTPKDIIIDIDFNISKPVKEIYKILNNDLCVENVNGYDFYFSNNLNEIMNEINKKTENLFDLNDVEWILLPESLEFIKDLMNKHQVNYSMYIYYEKEVSAKVILVFKRCGNEWFFAMIYDLTKLTDDIKKNQSINLRISFKKSSITISNIIPVIDQIYFQTENNLKSTIFTALHTNKNRKIMTDDNNFEYYKIDNIAKVVKTEFGIESECKLVGLKLNHFLPKIFAYVYFMPERMVKIDIEMLMFYFISDSYSFSNLSVNDYNNTIKKFLTDKIGEEGKFHFSYTDNIDKSKIKIELEKFTIPEKIKINNKQDFIYHVKESISQIKKSNIPKLFTDGILLYQKNFNINLNPELDDAYSFPYGTEYYTSDPFIHDGVNDITNYFQNNVEYIGPLREEPHLQYNGYIDNLTNIGTKGENCAAVFYYSKNKIIKNIDPQDFKYSLNFIRKKRLNNALNEWLNYIGVSLNVDVCYNRYGYELKIESMDTGKNKLNSDLTNVGVGVSQILPIVLACLLAPEESTIIIEQPELHLHPAMQTKLTDFFIATMSCNKQLIIETHSEYIINQLRLRVANGTIKEPDKKLNIYFTENLREDYNEYKAGNTTFRQLKINKYAAISDWPDGFFDESQLVREEIIEAVGKRLEEDSPDE
jgi:predicted ATPase